MVYCSMSSISHLKLPKRKWLCKRKQIWRWLTVVSKLNVILRLVMDCRHFWIKTALVLAQNRYKSQLQGIMDMLLIGCWAIFVNHLHYLEHCIHHSQIMVKEEWSLILEELTDVIAHFYKNFSLLVSKIIGANSKIMVKIYFSYSILVKL